ncbi:MAG: hypothetical protein NTV32_04690 [Gammaproteobacteria bacterium]|nr:hypothetical protein [Gammaproteobacteria bacterium]
MAFNIRKKQILLDMKLLDTEADVWIQKRGQASSNVLVSQAFAHCNFKVAIEIFKDYPELWFNHGSAADLLKHSINVDCTETIRNAIQVMFVAMYHNESITPEEKSKADEALETLPEKVKKELRVSLARYAAIHRKGLMRIPLEAQSEAYKRVVSSVHRSTAATVIASLKRKVFRIEKELTPLELNACLENQYFLLGRQLFKVAVKRNDAGKITEKYLVSAIAPDKLTNFWIELDRLEPEQDSAAISPGSRQVGVKLMLSHKEFYELIFKNEPEHQLAFVQEPIVTDENTVIRNALCAKIKANQYNEMNFKQPEYKRFLLQALRLGEITENELLTAFLLYDGLLAFNKGVMPDDPQAGLQRFQLKVGPDREGAGPYNPEAIEYADGERLRNLKDALKPEDHYYTIPFNRDQETLFFYEVLWRVRSVPLMGIANQESLFFIALRLYLLNRLGGEDALIQKGLVIPPPDRNYNKLLAELKNILEKEGLSKHITQKSIEYETMRLLAQFIPVSRLSKAMPILCLTPKKPEEAENPSFLSMMVFNTSTLNKLQRSMHGEETTEVSVVLGPEQPRQIRSHLIPGEAVGGSENRVRALYPEGFSASYARPVELTAEDVLNTHDPHGTHPYHFMLTWHDSFHSWFAGQNFKAPLRHLMSVFDDKGGYAALKSKPGLSKLLWSWTDMNFTVGDLVLRHQTPTSNEHYSALSFMHILKRSEVFDLKNRINLDFMVYNFVKDEVRWRRVFNLSPDLSMEHFFHQGFSLNTPLLNEEEFRVLSRALSSARKSLAANPEMDFLEFTLQERYGIPSRINSDPSDALLIKALFAIGGRNFCYWDGEKNDFCILKKVKDSLGLTEASLSRYSPDALRVYLSGFIKTYPLDDLSSEKQKTVDQWRSRYKVADTIDLSRIVVELIGLDSNALLKCSDPFYQEEIVNFNGINVLLNMLVQPPLDRADLIIKALGDVAFNDPNRKVIVNNESQFNIIASYLSDASESQKIEAQRTIKILAQSSEMLEVIAMRLMGPHHGAKFNKYIECCMTNVENHPAIVNALAMTPVEQSLPLVFKMLEREDLAPNIKIKLAKTLMNSSFRYAMNIQVYPGALNALITLLKDESPEIKIYAAATLGNITALVIGDNLPNVISIFNGMLNHPDLSQQFSSLEALKKIPKEIMSLAEDQKTPLIQSILKLIDSPNQKVQIASLDCLFNLLGIDPEKIHIIMSDSNKSLLISLLLFENEAVCSPAISCIGRLGHFHSIRNKINEEHIGILIGRLDSPLLMIKKPALFVLFSIAFKGFTDATSVEARNKIVMAGGVAPLITLLYDQNEIERKITTEFLMTVISAATAEGENKKFKVACLDAGAVYTAMSILKKDKDTGVPEKADLKALLSLLAPEGSLYAGIVKTKGDISQLIALRLSNSYPVEIINSALAYFCWRSTPAEQERISALRAPSAPMLPSDAGAACGGAGQGSGGGASDASAFAISHIFGDQSASDKKESAEQKISFGSMSD